MSQYDFSKIIFPKSIVVTGQTIDVSFLSESQQYFYKSLFIEMLDLYVSRKQARMLVGLAGPTGSGKSVITMLFREFARQVELPFKFETLSIDAFHYQNDFLESHKNNDGRTLKEVKGRFDTYNVPKLVLAIKEYKSGKTVSLPEYSRNTHNPIEHSYTIHEDKVLLILEGLWIFDDHGKWPEVTSLLDYKIFIDANEEKVKAMVVERHMKGGKSFEEANAYYDTVDAIDSKLVKQTKDRVDKCIPAYCE